MRPRTPSFFKLTSAVTLCSTLAAHAHPGHYHPPQEVDEFDTESLMSAVTHPFTGVDHLLVALAVGAVAFMMGKRLGFMLSLLFLSSLALGFASAKLAVAMPMVEQGLALSVLAAGILLMPRQRVSSLTSFCVVALIGFWHGNAHGLEMGQASLGAALVLGSGTALMLGVGSARLMMIRSPLAVRCAGVAVAIVGMVLCAVRFS